MWLCAQIPQVAWIYPDYIWLHVILDDGEMWMRPPLFSWTMSQVTDEKCIVKLFHILILQTFTFSFEFAYSLMQWFYWLPPLEMFPLFLLLFHWFVQKFQALYVIIMHHWQLPVNKMEKNRIKIRTSRWNFGLSNHLAGEDCLKD